MQDDQTNNAIDAALKCDWQKAIDINSHLLKSEPNDLDCLNRLGKAYLENGDNKKASLYFRKVLKIDKYNPIAQKNLARASDTKTTKKSSGATKSQATFLEEPGKTKLIALVNVAPASILLKQDNADCLTLSPKRHTVVVEDADGNYLGALPDDMGHRLGVLIKGGNKYEATVKSVSKSSLVVFLRELERSKKFHNTPSFLNSNSADYLSSIREEIVVSEPTEETEDHEHPDLHQDEEPETP